MITIIKSIVNKKQRYYFATSMGVDSVSAFYWMVVKGYNVSPIHFNHGLRTQNDLMEYKYLELCRDTNKTPIIGKGKNLATELDCRNARLEFYKTLEKGSIILTAHHLNDCVESYLLNCFRGKPDHKFFSLTSEFPQYKIVHPFLLSKKKDFVQYAERNDLTQFVVCDETNNLIKGSRRNWIRGCIVPEMKRQKMNLERYCEDRIKEMLKEPNESKQNS